jgi:A/G-specific adenine glycosylase
VPDVVRHTFTHFHLELAVLAGKARAGASGDGVWVPLDRLKDHALPSVMKKVIAHASGGFR